MLRPVRGDRRGDGLLQGEAMGERVEHLRQGPHTGDAAIPASRGPSRSRVLGAGGAGTSSDRQVRTLTAPSPGGAAGTIRDASSDGDVDVVSIDRIARPSFGDSRGRACELRIALRVAAERPKKLSDGLRGLGPGRPASLVEELLPGVGPELLAAGEPAIELVEEVDALFAVTPAEPRPFGRRAARSRRGRCAGL